MIVLGIETSCDETAASLVKNGRFILSNIVSSSLNFHKRYGGVIPEIASREHLESINFVVQEALAKARLKLNEIDLIAVTSHPGLIGSLLVGISFARALSYAIKKPLLEINHIQAHIFASFLQKPLPKLPAVGLVASGGHTSLFYLKDFNKISLLGETLDDAAGEAFDKVAKILGLGYPGGPIIDRLSKKGNPNQIKFKCGLSHGLDFSFSGIKTAVLYYVNSVRDKSLRGPKNGWSTERVKIKDIASSFQEAVINCLVEKTLRACKLKKTKTLLAGGGVLANSRLRRKIRLMAKKEALKVYLPDKNLCLDNAAMVASSGYYKYFRKSN